MVLSGLSILAKLHLEWSDASVKIQFVHCFQKMVAVDVFVAHLLAGDDRCGEGEGDKL